MMGMTHLALGIASALAAAHPGAPAECIVPVVGSAIGSILPDVDIHTRKGRREALFTRLAAIGIAVVLLPAGLAGETGIYALTGQRSPQSMLIGTLLMTWALLQGRCSRHRTFTHSLLFALVTGYAVQCICPPFLPSFLLGMGTHLAADLMNRSPMRLLYPLKKGICLNLCRSGGRVNRALCTLSAGYIAYVLGSLLFSMTA